MQIYLIRHGETAWSRTGQHTGHTDLPLTQAGEDRAHQLADVLRPLKFNRVLCSPLLRARRTCLLAGYDAAATVEPNLREWDYGTYEGLTTREIHQEQPGWEVFHHGGPGGESPAQVTQRVDAVVSQLRQGTGNVAIFSHGHLLRALAVRWIGLPIETGTHFILDTASLSILAYKYNDPTIPVIALWNGGLSANAQP